MLTTVASLALLSSAAHAACTFPVNAPCDPNGIAICTDGACDLAPYSHEISGALLYLVTDTATAGAIDAYGTDSWGNPFHCEVAATLGEAELQATFHVTTSEQDDEVFTWATGPWCDGSGVDHLGHHSRPKIVLTVELGAGDDRLDSTKRGNVSVVAYGDDGNDRLIGGQELPTSPDRDCSALPRIGRACQGGDELHGGRGRDQLFSGNIGALDYETTGLDLLLGEQGNDTLVGAAGDDALDGGPGDDTLNGRRGADDVEGGRGADLVCGGAGEDVVSGGDDADVVIGDRGQGDTAVDAVEGGAGTDRCDDRDAPGCERPLLPTDSCPN